MTERVKMQLAGVPPDGWGWKESLTLFSPGGDANVIFSSEPLDPEIGLERYQEIQGELLNQEFQGYEELALEQTRVMGGRPGYLRRFTWTPPGSHPVTQIQLYSVDDGRGYTATATTAATSFDELEPQLSEILGSLAFEGAPGPARPPLVARSE